MRTRYLIAAALFLAAPTAEAQRRAPWTFGPLWPHVEDAGKRTAYAVAFGALFMGAGLGIDKLNNSSCSGGAACFAGNPVQTGISFAFLGVLMGSSAPMLHSKCTRSGRAMLGIVGGILGTAVAGSIVDSKMFGAHRDEPATWKVMGGGLLGMSAGAGIATAIC
jgi:hypothetical protein